MRAMLAKCMACTRHRIDVPEIFAARPHFDPPRGGDSSARRRSFLRVVCPNAYNDAHNA